MKEFEYRAATDVADAVALLSGSHGSRYVAGGTNLVDLMKIGVESPGLLVDVRDIGLGRVESAPDGGLRIGAAVTNSDLAAHPDVRLRYPALSAALLAGASGQLRNMATVGGNLMQRTRCAYFADTTMPCNKRSPGTGCSAHAGEHHNHAIFAWTGSCVATHPSDMAVAMAAFDAVVEFESASGGGEVPLVDFYLPVGDTPHVETALPAGALITGVRLPASETATGSIYRKVRERASFSFATVSVAAALRTDEGLIRSVRLAFGGVASRPWRARAAEASLVGSPAVPEVFAAAADAELAAARPLPRNHYKVELMRNLMGAVLSDLNGEVGR